MQEPLSIRMRELADSKNSGRGFGFFLLVLAIISFCYVLYRCYKFYKFQKEERAMEKVRDEMDEMRVDSMNGSDDERNCQNKEREMNVEGEGVTTGGEVI